MRLVKLASVIAVCGAPLIALAAPTPAEILPMGNQDFEAARFLETSQALAQLAEMRTSPELLQYIAVFSKPENMKLLGERGLYDITNQLNSYLSSYRVVNEKLSRIEALEKETFGNPHIDILGKASLENKAKTALNEYKMEYMQIKTQLDDIGKIRIDQGGVAPVFEAQVIEEKRGFERAAEEGKQSEKIMQLQQTLREYARSYGVNMSSQQVKALLMEKLENPNPKPIALKNEPEPLPAAADGKDAQLAGQVVQGGEQNGLKQGEVQADQIVQGGNGEQNGLKQEVQADLVNGNGAPIKEADLPKDIPKWDPKNPTNPTMKQLEDYMHQLELGKNPVIIAHDDHAKWVALLEDFMRGTIKEPPPGMDDKTIRVLYELGDRQKMQDALKDALDRLYKPNDNVGKIPLSDRQYEGFQKTLDELRKTDTFLMLPEPYSKLAQDLSKLPKNQPGIRDFATFLEKNKEQLINTWGVASQGVQGLDAAENPPNLEGVVDKPNAAPDLSFLDDPKGEKLKLLSINEAQMDEYIRLSEGKAEGDLDEFDRLTKTYIIMWQQRAKNVEALKNAGFGPWDDVKGFGPIPGSAAENIPKAKLVVDAENYIKSFQADTIQFENDVINKLPTMSGIRAFWEAVWKHTLGRIFGSKWMIAWEERRARVQEGVDDILGKNRPPPEAEGEHQKSPVLEVDKDVPGPDIVDGGFGPLTKEETALELIEQERASILFKRTWLSIFREGQELGPDLEVDTKLLEDRDIVTRIEGLFNNAGVAITRGARPLIDNAAGDFVVSAAEDLVAALGGNKGLQQILIKMQLKHQLQLFDKSTGKLIDLSQFIKPLHDDKYRTLLKNGPPDFLSTEEKKDLETLYKINERYSARDLEGAIQNANRLRQALTGIRESGNYGERGLEDINGIYEHFTKTLGIPFKDELPPSEMEKRINFIFEQVNKDTAQFEKMMPILREALAKRYLKLKEAEERPQDAQKDVEPRVEEKAQANQNPPKGEPNAGVNGQPVPDDGQNARPVNGVNGAEGQGKLDVINNLKKVEPQQDLDNKLKQDELIRQAKIKEVELEKEKEKLRLGELEKKKADEERLKQEKIKNDQLEKEKNRLAEIREQELKQQPKNVGLEEPKIEIKKALALDQLSKEELLARLKENENEAQKIKDLRDGFTEDGKPIKLPLTADQENLLDGYQAERQGIEDQLTKRFGWVKPKIIIKQSEEELLARLKENENEAQKIKDLQGVRIVNGKQWKSPLTGDQQHLLEKYKLQRQGIENELRERFNWKDPAKQPTVNDVKDNGYPEAGAIEEVDEHLEQDDPWESIQERLRKFLKDPNVKNWGKTPQNTDLEKAVLEGKPYQDARAAFEDIHTLDTEERFTREMRKKLLNLVGSNAAMQHLYLQTFSGDPDFFLDSKGRILKAMSQDVASKYLEKEMATAVGNYKMLTQGASQLEGAGDGLSYAVKEADRQIAEVLQKATYLVSHGAKFVEQNLREGARGDALIEELITRWSTDINQHTVLDSMRFLAVERAREKIEKATPAEAERVKEAASDYETNLIKNAEPNQAEMKVLDQNTIINKVADQQKVLKELQRIEEEVDKVSAGMWRGSAQEFNAKIAEGKTKLGALIDQADALRKGMDLSPDLDKKLGQEIYGIIRSNFNNIEKNTKLSALFKKRNKGLNILKEFQRKLNIEGNEVPNIESGWKSFEDSFLEHAQVV